MSQSIEQKLNGWTGPSSATEQDKQDRTVRMIREAISGHDAFKGVKLVSIRRVLIPTTRTFVVIATSMWQLNIRRPFTRTRSPQGSSRRT